MGGLCLLRGGCLLQGVSAPGRVSAPWVCLLPGGPGGDPPTDTAAGDTHPTGMDSCLECVWIYLSSTSDIVLNKSKKD